MLAQTVITLADICVVVDDFYLHESLLELSILPSLVQHLSLKLNLFVLPFNLENLCQVELLVEALDVHTSYTSVVVVVVEFECLVFHEVGISLADLGGDVQIAEKVDVARIWHVDGLRKHLVKPHSHLLNVDAEYMFEVFTARFLVHVYRERVVFCILWDLGQEVENLENVDKVLETEVVSE
jgi:hypothetical protein